MTDQVTHPLLAYPEAERVAYLSIIAELSNVDSKFDEQERQHLDEQLKAFEISDEGGVPPSGVNAEDQHRLRRC